MEEVNETKNKKNLPIFSIVLAIGLAVLYFLHFNDQKETSVKNNVGKPEPVVMPAVKTGSIAFVNSEVLLQNYDLVTKLSNQLDKQKQNKDADFTKGKANMNKKQPISSSRFKHKAYQNRVPRKFTSN